MLVALASPVFGQGAPVSPSAPYIPTLTFDVASVRENKTIPDPDAGVEDPAYSSKFVARGVPARFLVQKAYGIQPFQLAGGPDWFNSALFNIQAQSDALADGRLAQLSGDQASMEKQHMLQLLLVDRFNLKAHWGKKEMPTYALVVAKGRPKLQPAGSMPPTALELKQLGNNKIPVLQQNFSKQGEEYIAHGCSMQALVDAMMREVGTMVVDKTGLAGTYDFTLQFNGVMPGERNDDPAHWPSLVSAITDRLGLRLESTKDTISILIIDHMDKPSEN
jgi:uncharacterized protein (TIGR03435 family)